MKTLVVYFSRKGYVKKIAQKKADKYNADLLELKTTEPTKGYLGFWWCGRFAMHRWEMPLEEYTVDVLTYDKIIICSPIWVFTFCCPIRAFLKKEKGRIKAADYVFVHYSFPMNYRKTADCADNILSIKHDKLESICCIFGKIMKTRLD